MECGRKKLGLLDISYNLKENLICLFQESFSMESTSFKRCIQPQEATDSPNLVIFSDASKQRLGLRHEKNGKFEGRLIAAKKNIAPLKKLSVLRLEMNAAAMSKGLANFINK